MRPQRPKRAAMHVLTLKHTTQMKRSELIESLKKANSEFNQTEVISFMNLNDIDYTGMNDMELFIAYLQAQPKEDEQSIPSLQEEFEQYKRESIKWSVEDFLGDDNYFITPEKAQEALEQMIRKHDASWGITWETVKVYLEEYGTEMGKFLVKDRSGRGVQVVLDTRELIENWGKEFVEDGDEGLTFAEWAMDADIGDKETVDGQATTIERIE